MNQIQQNDISPDWKGSTALEIKAIDHILRYEGTPLAILSFDRLRFYFGDYWYWFMLSTLWISYSGRSDLKLWRRLFRAGRKRRRTSIMKPSELRAFEQLPERLKVYRAHRQGETDWISYTTDRQIAERWVRERGGYLGIYRLRKKDCIALFLRRGEREVLMLDPHKAKLVKEDCQCQA